MDGAEESMLNFRDGKSYCSCAWVKEKELTCSCGEIDHEPSWKWDEDAKTPAAILSHDCQRVHFHKDYSVGNACIRGDTAMVSGYDYYWEIKMLSFVYGTSMMIGVGTENFNINQSNEKFCNLLGSDSESWGMKFDGRLYHNNTGKEYHPLAGFRIGSIVGVHLDMWNGRLEFYLNRTPLGVAFDGLKNKILYPMISSTASPSIMKLIFAHSEPYSLSLMTAKLLNTPMIENLPPGLKQLEKSWWWLFPKPTGPQSNGRNRKSEYLAPSRGVYVFIDSDEEEYTCRNTSTCNILTKRMKKVLDMSRHSMVVRSEGNIETNHNSSISGRPIRFFRHKTKPWMDY